MPFHCFKSEHREEQWRQNGPASREWPVSWPLSVSIVENIIPWIFCNRSFHCAVTQKSGFAWTLLWTASIIDNRSSVRRLLLIRRVLSFMLLFQLWAQTMLDRRRVSSEPLRDAYVRKRSFHVYQYWILRRIPLYDMVEVEHDLLLCARMLSNKFHSVQTWICFKSSWWYLLTSVF